MKWIGSLPQAARAHMRNEHDSEEEEEDLGGHSTQEALVLFIIPTIRDNGLEPSYKSVLSQLEEDCWNEALGYIWCMKLTHHSVRSCHF